MSNIKLMAIDLAKSVFQVCGLDCHNKVLFNKKLSRNKLIQFMACQQPTNVYMEACYSSHYWGRKLTEFGHTVFLIPAQHVTPFVRGNKNDRNDALAIAECSNRPNLKFVPIKSEHQQEIISLHRIRQRLIKNKTQITNQTRGLLTDFGIIFAVGQKAFTKTMKAIESEELLSPQFRQQILLMKEEFDYICERIKTVEKHLTHYNQTNKNCMIVNSIPSVGYLTATTIVAMIDKGQAFSKASDIGVWVGLTPKQFASGNKSRLGRITKRGDRYLRFLLTRCGNVAIQMAKERNDQFSLWIRQLVKRIGRSKAIVAIAHKIIRIAWVLLQKQEVYKVQ